ncbi:MAG: DUF1587 domain-containing protein, partial [Planctomycetota bacterium]|nr:DUF1587 domain-containing protein [Planctomycetota bacterium]
AQDPTLSLEKARELGRNKSRYLNETIARPKTAIPKANLTDFITSVQPSLKKSCLGCHGPDKSEGRLRVDQLDPDLLKGPDVLQWREIYNVLSNSEMPPDDEPEFELDDENRRNIIDWLSEELNKASTMRRNQGTHSSFRRLTNYEYDYALQDLLGLPYSFSEKLPPETASEDGFKNSSQLLQMSPMQFETYRAIGLKSLKRATVIGERPKPVTYILSMAKEMEKIASGSKVKMFDKSDQRNRQRLHLFNRDTGKGIQFSNPKPKPDPGAVAGQPSKVSPVVLAFPRSNELKMNLDRFLPDDGVMRVSIRAGRSNMNDDEYASLRLIFSAHTSNNASFTQVISKQDVPVTASIENPQFIHFDIPLADIQRNPFRKSTIKFPRRDEFLHIKNISNAHGKEPLQVLIDRIEISAPFYEQWPPKTHTQIFFENEKKVMKKTMVVKFCRDSSNESGDALSLPRKSPRSCHYLRIIVPSFPILKRPCYRFLRQPLLHRSFFMSLNEDLLR